MEDDTKNCGNHGDLNNHVKTLVIDGEKVLWYDLGTTTSTMDQALKIAGENCNPWTVVSAHRQAFGRGTHGRTWFSPEGKGLWISVILPPPVTAEQLSDLSILAAQVLVESFKEFTELQFDIKYPNDVIIKGRKIAGILCESITRGERVVSVILGIGVNFQQTREDFEREGLDEATSLFIEIGYVPDRREFLKVFLKRLKPVYEEKVLTSV